MTFFHRPVGLVELLILYARVQFYTPRASDYRLISKTEPLEYHWPFAKSMTNFNQRTPRIPLAFCRVNVKL